MKTRHTPTPWKYDEKQGVIIDKDSGEVIADLQCNADMSREEMNANGKWIVAVVNKALKKA